MCVTADLNELRISTHTLTWSVTKMKKRFTTTLDISTHTLTWSVTDFKLAEPAILEFQLTRSRGA